MVTQSLGKSLYEVLKMNDFVPFSLSQVRDFSRQLVEALDFLRGMKLIHTDLKPENILLLHPELHSEMRNGKPYYIPRSTEIRSECCALEHAVPRVATCLLTSVRRGQSSISAEPRTTTSGRARSSIRASTAGRRSRWSWAGATRRTCGPSAASSPSCIRESCILPRYVLHATRRAVRRVLTVWPCIATQHDNLEHLGLMEQALGRFPPEMIAKSPVRRMYFSADGSVRWDELDRDSRRHIRNMKTIEVRAVRT